MTDKRIIIIGASGHGKVVAEIAHLNGYKDIVFLDDNEDIKKCGGHPVIGSIADIDSIEGDVIIAIGDNAIRKTIQSRLSSRQFATLVHPNAVVSSDSIIGEGTVIMAGVVINPGVSIGRGVIINTSSSVDHDSIISDYVHIAVGAHICGSVTICDGSWIGAGTTVINNVKIVANCFIGAGAVVIKDLATEGKYVGVPAKLI